MKSFFVVIGLLLIMTTIVSCSKDKSIQNNDSISGSNAASVFIPSWVGTSIVGEMIHPANNPLTLEGIDLGRELFYETQLSGDNTMSCASCHFQEFNFSDSARFSTGITGAMGDRQAMSIVNLAWDDSFFWDGRAISLEDQALGPVVNPIELNSAYSLSLPSSPPNIPALMN